MQPNYPQYQPAPQNSTLAIVSLIAAICGFTVFPGLGSLVAVITGHMAKGEIARSGGTLGGGGAATWGLVLGYVGLAVWVLVGCMVLALTILPFILLAASGQNSLLPIVAGLV